jgi:hypothetical protein
MRGKSAVLVFAAFSASALVAQAQTPAAASATTDVYHVMFVKAAPGQAAALAKQLQEQDPKDPMAAHYLLLRHQEGADWDYCLIQHAGTKASVEIPATPPAAAPPTIAWHDDTFVAGPSWSEFQKVIGLSDTPPGSPIYVVGVHRAVPGHRQQLLDALNAPTPNSKPAPPNVTLTHVEGGQWQYLTVTRYSSWQELGSDRQPGGEGWNQIRQHSAFHTDTITDRVR